MYFSCLQLSEVAVTGLKGFKVTRIVFGYKFRFQRFVYKLWVAIEKRTRNLKLFTPVTAASDFRTFNNARLKRGFLMGVFHKK